MLKGLERWASGGENANQQDPEAAPEVASSAVLPMNRKQRRKRAVSVQKKCRFRMSPAISFFSACRNCGSGDQGKRM